MKSIRVLWAVLLTVSGSTWVLAAEPVRVVPEGAIINPRQPQAAVDSQKNIYVAFGSGESIYCSTSTDDGKSFGTPNQVGSVQKLALGRPRSANRRRERLCGHYRDQSRIGECARLAFHGPGTEVGRARPSE